MNNLNLLKINKKLIFFLSLSPSFFSPFFKFAHTFLCFLIFGLIIQSGNKKNNSYNLVENIYLKCINDFHAFWVFLFFHSFNSLGKLILNIDEINIASCSDCKTQTEKDMEEYLKQNADVVYKKSSKVIGSRIHEKTDNERIVIDGSFTKV